MKARQIGDDLETMCEGCGEVMLVCDGDLLNFRIGEDSVPEGFLCAVCNRKENGNANNVVKIGRLRCVCCGRDLDSMEDTFEPHYDEDGFMNGAVCEGCSFS